MFETADGFAQVLPRQLFGLVGPEQTGQCFAPQGGVGVQGEIGQQGAGFVGGQAQGGRGRDGAEEGQGELGHVAHFTRGWRFWIFDFGFWVTRW